MKVCVIAGPISSPFCCNIESAFNAYEIEMKRRKHISKHILAITDETGEPSYLNHEIESLNKEELKKLFKSCIDEYLRPQKIVYYNEIIRDGK